MKSAEVWGTENMGNVTTLESELDTLRSDCTTTSDDADGKDIGRRVQALRTAVPDQDSTSESHKPHQSSKQSRPRSMRLGSRTIPPHAAQG